MSDVTSAVPCTFHDLFELPNLSIQSVRIPCIQRDYAQGRTDPDSTHIRTRFLQTLRGAFKGTPVHLDFVYGSIDSGVLTLLDGQQRLTTLFLLHWYAAKKDHIAPGDCDFLRHFSYETRPGARDFCARLLDWEPSPFEELAKQIVDQNWFLMEWERDPTVSSMLVMIDAIHKNFHNVPDLWNDLLDGAITFSFLPIKDFGLTDDLYIRMNSRGKALTRFEHFKADLERRLRDQNSADAECISRKIDTGWTDMLWCYRGSDNDIGDEFLRYFRFICDVVRFENGDGPTPGDWDESDLLDYFFGPRFQENRSTLELYFDCWCKPAGFDSPTAFIQHWFTDHHENSKILLHVPGGKDLFGYCLRTYGTYKGRTPVFSLSQMILLYAVIQYLLNSGKITAPEFFTRMRIIRNLVQNSTEEIRLSGKRMTALLKHTRHIMKTGDVAQDRPNTFSHFQFEEEKNKMDWLNNNLDKAEALYALEDHPLLYGQISILGTDHIDRASAFCSLFSDNCDRDKISCALMAMGFYPQQEKEVWKYQFGCSSDDSWKALFHHSEQRKGWENTQKALRLLLSKRDTFDDTLLDQIAKKYLKTRENEKSYDFGYYYVKYPAFRNSPHGKYYHYPDKDPFLYLVMQTPQLPSTSTYDPFLWEAGGGSLSCPYTMKTYLVYKGDLKYNGGIAQECRIYSRKDGFSFREPPKGRNDQKGTKGLWFLKISQENGVDSEDRIEVLKKHLNAKTLPPPRQ